jgi:hypothetical protein
MSLVLSTFIFDKNAAVGVEKDPMVVTSVINCQDRLDRIPLSRFQSNVLFEYSHVHGITHINTGDFEERTPVDGEEGSRRR